ncbi:GLR3.2 [Symbiodinium necroappetens]|uniref:GLR3.2 protein n=1 Tax=Symbiodinium necroappetens TaxID=1628268 RepID=A0A812Y4R7_9DINO|nr:GLR3.2 [Symbiodinium necroappetens]|mmetsp:Transcript_55587/g.132951  ORF Transcript_55587/g.132951 Transcript_55587/m.132951 type:complete len:629 (+) Transcript_55587:43-1929(+)
MVLRVLAWAAAGSLCLAEYAPECPCINASSTLFTDLQTELVAQGLDASYGTTGCDAYDANSSSVGCESNAAPHCMNQWCYVDMTLCPVNKLLCLAEGGLEGSDASPHCRTRPHSRTTMQTNMSLYYSYETCGYMNNYDLSALFSQLGGTAIKVAASAYGSWVILKQDALGQDVFGGALYDLFVESLVLIQPPPVMKLIPGWATQQSRAIFPSSSYTACVHDVGIGVFDVCVADLWLTPERQQLSTFSPTLRDDYFYLVVPTTLQDASFSERLLRPFLPFTLEAWAVLAAFLCGMSLLLYFLHYFEQGQGCPGPVRGFSEVPELGKTCFNVWHDFLLGQSTVETERSPALKLLSLGFSFFVLVTLASYTASLASMLVTQKQAVSPISNIQDAIDLEVPICLVSQLVPTFTQVYPRAIFVNIGSGMEDGARNIYSGNCGAMILSQDLIDRLHAGLVQENDCADLAAGSITEEEAHCRTDSKGNPRNDCKFDRVGDILWAIPVAFPLSQRALRSLSYSLTTGLARGMLQDAIRANEFAFPAPNCDKALERSELGGLQAGDMVGTIMISVLILGVGVACCAAQAVAKRLWPQVEASEHPDANEEAAIGEAEHPQASEEATASQADEIHVSTL